MIRLLFPLLLAIVAGMATAESDLERTWRHAQVWLPGTVSAVTPADIPATTEASAVILYAHGCDGPGRITTASARFLAGAGYLVVAPDSFARSDKPRSCDPAIPRGGLHRAVLGWRQAEMRHAMTQLRDMPATRVLPVALMGHSEGAITVATMTAPDAALRIIEGWTCHAGWPAYRGLNAPTDQPVLSLVGAQDPWFRLPVLHGDCGAFMTDGGPMRSVVYDPPGYLAERHWLSADQRVRATILEFLSDNLPAEEDAK
ncbi:hypothetical protein [Sediminimonas sp.]|uniref:dienelactone hydrolase family protein n=1 Tax=Sediminimonas sp. TaxID=2823379 RepID=UPI0025CD1E26|nr:hypothetical protein [Sediminimonas sp.]